jgi:protein tyrosine/serine phosphatase
MNNGPALPFARSYWVQSGQFLAGFYPGSPDYEEATKKLSGLLDCGIRHVINLMEEGETDQSGLLFTPYAENLVALGKQRGIEVAVTRYPIKDVSIPSAGKMKAILDEIDRSLSANRPVYVHCWGGRGRTGTIVGCYLVRHGMTGEEALKRIKELRRNEPTGHLASPEAREQKEMVLSWEKLDKKT